MADGSTATARLTTAQALVRYLSVQSVERDGVETPLIAGCFGIFGHGNVGGLAQALHQYRGELQYYLGRNEQSMVHIAAGYAKAKDRLSTLAVAASIGPGSTNLVTGAAAATVNRLPVLLLPADAPARRLPRPVLQQLEPFGTGSMSMNDTLKPVSVFWDRLERPEQLLWTAPEAMRMLTDQAHTGAVTVCLPTDVQSEAHDFPEEFFRPRTWHVGRPIPDASSVARAAELIRYARRPLIVSGGGVIYSDASQELRRFVEATGIPSGETMAGKGALAYDHPLNMGAIGVNGTPGSYELAQGADVVIGIGTRWTDVTSVSQTAFANPDVRFVNINIASFDAHKFSGASVVGDARASLGALLDALQGYQTDAAYRERASSLAAAWDREVQTYFEPEASDGGMTQAEAVGAVNDIAGSDGVVVAAAGSLPNDLHKLWRTRDRKAYHVEYGFSTMGYEIPGAVGVKLAQPDRDVYAMIGDGAYMMSPGELATAVQERLHIVVVLIQNHGFSSVGALSKRLGAEGFGTRYRYRTESGNLDGDRLPVDLAANAESLGATVFRASDRADLVKALEAARAVEGPVLIEVETDPDVFVPRRQWWDVPIAEVSESVHVQTAREGYDEHRKMVRNYF